MAGSSHNYSMNINIKAQADGISKTNKEITQLNNEVKGLDGKKISLNIQLGGNASKDIQSVVKSIGSIEKSLNSLSGKGLQTLEQGFSTLTKAANDVVSGIGSIQKSLDGLSGRGPESVASSMGSITKSSADASSGVGTVQTALDSLSTGNIEEIQSALGSLASTAQETASAVNKVAETSGLGDNWNNSYGGRYGGMRYTGQGKGISDVVSFLGGGKNSYQLTVENAMNKTRNMAVAKSWTPEDGVTGMDAYWALDTATNDSLMSLNALAAGINATAATTGASAKDIYKHAQDFADFGTMVMGLGYSEDVAQTAVMKLGRGLHGTFAALDQYGITKESLMNTGLWNGDESDLDGYMAAVSKYSKGMSDNLMKTPTGQVATLSKSASLGGYALGQMEAEWTAGLATWFKNTDTDMRNWTKSMGWGADVRDNWGNRVLSKVGADGNEKSVYVDSQGNLLDEQNQVVRAYGSEQDAIAALESEGYKQKKTGFSLSTLIIGADQVISTYKTIKDTILGTYAEWRDLKRLFKEGLSGIFDESRFRRNSFGNFEEIHDSACEEMGKDCPANGGGKGKSKNKKKKKKKSRIGSLMDSIGSSFDNAINTITGRNPNKGKSKKTPEQKRKRSLNKEWGNKYTSRTGDYNLNSVGAGMGLLDKKAQSNINRINRKSQKRNESGTSMHSLNPDRFQTKQSRADTPKTLKTRKVKRNGLQINKFIPVEDLVPNGSRYYSTKKGSSSAKFKGHSSDPVNTDTFYKWKQEGLAKPPVPLGNDNKINSYKPKSTLGAIDVTPTKIEKINTPRDKLKKYFSKGNKEREAYANQYGGYMKRTNKAIFDTKQLRKKASAYIKNKKKFLKDEYAKTQFKSGEMKKSWAKKGRQLPYRAWDKAKSGASSLGSSINTRLGDSFLGTQYGALKRQGSTLKNAVKDSRAWQTLAPIGGAAKTAGSTVKSQVAGNAKALGRMTGFTPWFMSTKTGQKLNSGYQNIKQQGMKTTVGGKLTKVGGALKAGGSRVMGAAATGMGALAGGLGKIGGIIGGIGGAFMGLMGPIGAVIMGVTLFMGLCDALGIDLSPLKEAFGGFMQALQPAIQGLNQWIAGFAKQLGPALTALGKVLGPILQAIGGLLSGGLGALASIFGPIIDGIGAIFGGGSGKGMFDGLAEGLGGLADVFQQLGPVVQGFWEMMGQGAEGVGGFLGGIFDGIGMYITHVVQEWANTISLFWTTIAQGISTAISTVATAITNSITSIATTVGSAITTVATASISAILGLGGAVGGAIVSILGGIAMGIIMIGTAIGTYILTIGTVISGVVSMFGASIGAAMAGIGIGIATVITAISSAIIMGITGLATAITMGILMISTAILNSFTGFALVVATATADAYAALLAFQGSAVGLMGTIASDMVNAFTNNFHGIKEAVDAEMAGAYDRLCYWGDLMVAKAGQIGADVQARYKAESGIGSPGYVWLMTDAEWQGALSALRSGGMAMVKTAGTVAQRMAHNYQTSKPQNLFHEDMNLAPNVPYVAPPQVKEPKVSKDIRQQRANAVPQSPVFNYNHYGDVDNEERMQKTMKYFSDRIDFENKRANRTV